MTSANLWLLLLVAQNTSKTLIMRAAVGQRQPEFLYSAAVLATEGLKATLSTSWVLASGGSFRSISFFLRTEWRLFLRVMAPAAIYNAQQMLEFVALSRLEAPVFSIIVQTKLLTTGTPLCPEPRRRPRYSSLTGPPPLKTALFSVIMLRRKLRRTQARSRPRACTACGRRQSRARRAPAGDCAGAPHGWRRTCAGGPTTTTHTAQHTHAKAV